MGSDESDDSEHDGIKQRKKGAKGGDYGATESQEKEAFVPPGLSRQQSRAMVVSTMWDLDLPAKPMHLNSLDWFYRFFGFWGARRGTWNETLSKRYESVFQRKMSVEVPEFALNNPDVYRSLSPDNHSASEHIMTYVVRGVYFLAITFYCAVAVYDLHERGHDQALHQIIWFLNWVICLSSLWLGSSILSRRAIPTRMSPLLEEGSTLKGELRRNKRYLNRLFYITIFICLVLGLISFSGDLTMGLMMLNKYDPDFVPTPGPQYNRKGVLKPTGAPPPDFVQPSFLVDQYGQGAVWLWIVTALMSNMASYAGPGIFCTLLMIHRLKVISCFRFLGSGLASVEQAYQKVFDIDLTLNHFGHKCGPAATILYSCIFSKFFLSALLHVTATDEGGRWVTKPMEYPEIISAIVSPSLALIYFWTSIGLLNKECDYLKQVAVRLSVVLRNEEKKKKSGAKDFQAYTKAASLHFKLIGKSFDLGTVWKFLGGGASVWILMLRLKRWKLL